MRKAAYALMLRWLGWSKGVTGVNLAVDGSGVSADQLQITATIDGVSFHGWPIPISLA